MTLLSKAKVMMGAALVAAAGIASAGVPNTISFDNLTNIQLDAYTAGQIGASIARNSTNFSVPFIGVMARCNMGGVPLKCPIEFYDHDSGKLMGSVYLNVLNASIVGAPVYTPEYVNRIEISGWDQVPVTHIQIFEK